MFEHESDKYCVFRHATDWYGLPALAVREVSPAPKLVFVPNSDPLLAGLSHVRNEFLPVLRLPTLAAQAVGDASERQLLVVDGIQGAWGLLVDHVAGLEPLEVSLSHEAPGTVDWSAAIAGSATSQNRLIRVLDASRVYGFAERTLHHQWQSQHVKH